MKFDFLITDNQVIVGGPCGVRIVPKTQSLVDAAVSQDYKKVLNIMSCRSDIAFAYSKVGWAKMQTYFTSLSQNDQGVIIDLIQDADKHIVHQDGDHLLSYTYVKTTTPDMMLLWNGLKHLDDEDYYFIEMDEYGADNCNGGYYDNPFGICVNRSIFINEDHTDDAEFDEISIIPAVESIAPMPIKALSVVIINDCVCPVCGNNKCSTSEKSCWKCGASL